MDFKRQMVILFLVKLLKGEKCKMTTLFSLLKKKFQNFDITNNLFQHSLPIP